MTIKNKHIKSLLLLLASIAPLSSQAGDSTSGMSLLTQCKVALNVTPTSSGADMINFSLCTSYIAGTIDGLETFHDLLEYKKFAVKRHYCLPEGFTLMQGVMVVTHYLQKKPKDLHLNKRILVNHALMIAFPCPD